MKTHKEKISPDQMQYNNSIKVMINTDRRMFIKPQLFTIFRLKCINKTQIISYYHIYV